ncbi:MAG: hypothetical protein ABIR26_13620 [Ramlibacter sp.]
MTVSRHGLRAFRELARSLFAITVIAAALIAAWAMGELREGQLREGQARAQLVADALASRITRAVGLGIPLNRLEGVEALFLERMRSLSDVAAVTLQDAQGRILWIRLRGDGDGTGLPEGRSAKAPVKVEGVRVATVTLVWKETGIGTLMLRWLLPLAAVAAAIAAMAGLLLNRSWAGGAAARESLASAACQRIRWGDFGLRMAFLRRHDFDLRLPWLAGELRNLNEQYMRVCRLAQSLGKTEPDSERRAELEQLLRDTIGQDRFRGDGAQESLAVPGQQDARGRWHGATIAVAAWLCAVLAQVVMPEATARMPAAALLATVTLTGLLGFKLACRGACASAVTGFTLGFVAPGPGLAIPLLLLASPDTYQRLGVAGDALLAWSALGSLGVALTGSAPLWRLARAASRAKARCAA